MKNPFNYAITKDQKLIISRNNKQVMIVKGKKSEAFIQLLQDGDETSIQLRLTKLTGNYKRGNEKQNKG